MPRRKKKTDLPFWWRKQTGCYYVQIDGKQVRLSPDLDEAWRLYHELMGGKPEEPPPRPSPPRRTAGRSSSTCSLTGARNRLFCKPCCLV